jgi:hypothetical protein
VPLGPLVGADKDVLLEFWHLILCCAEQCWDILSFSTNLPIQLFPPQCCSA